jgi:hypothetical protein
VESSAGRAGLMWSLSDVACGCSLGSSLQFDEFDEVGAEPPCRAPGAGGCRLAGVTMSTRSADRRRSSSLMYRPAMIVLPAPGSSASKNRSFDCGGTTRRPRRAGEVGVERSTPPARRTRAGTQHVSGGARPGGYASTTHSPNPSPNSSTAAPTTGHHDVANLPTRNPSPSATFDEQKARLSVSADTELSKPLPQQLRQGWHRPARRAGPGILLPQSARLPSATNLE